MNPVKIDARSPVQTSLRLLARQLGSCAIDLEMTQDAKEMIRIRSPEISKAKFRDADISESSGLTSSEHSAETRWPVSSDAKSIDSFEKRRSSSPGSMSNSSSVRYTPTSRYYAANKGTNRLKTPQVKKTPSSNGKGDVSESPRPSRDIDEKTRAFHQLCKEFDSTELEIP